MPCDSIEQIFDARKQESVTLCVLLYCSNSYLYNIVIFRIDVSKMVFKGASCPRSQSSGEIISIYAISDFAL
jgi:hypothetical protein